ncbi:MAG: hypothetical protein ACSHW0_13865 [Thalassotalea sp.]
MKKSSYISAILGSYLVLNGCSKQTNDNDTTKASTTFTIETAQANLTFAKDQYLKMIDHLENKRHLHLPEACKADPAMICIPRSEEQGGIFADQYQIWTNGFFPGALWKLLSAKQNITWTVGEEEKLFDTARYYQKTLFADTTLDSTHDLGFMLYDSFGEALHYNKLDMDTRKAYLEALDTGRATLASRYSDEKGVIKSWDFIPTMKLSTIEQGQPTTTPYSLSDPWAYPVIVDNLMNLEYLLDSDVERYHEIAFNHAKYTGLNHYFYDKSDIEKNYPLAYHVFDYGANKPGNWQGLGNISAWARGQAWSLYGFVTVVEAIENAKVDLSSYPDFKAHLQRLLGSVEHLLEDGYVPYWDFFAARDNAYEYAENTSPATAIYSGILELCDKRMEANIKPYTGYRPQILDASILSSESLIQLQDKENWYGEPILQGGKLVPCGSKPYAQSHQKIPRDSSASAVFASALYRYAIISKDEKAKQRYAQLADNIMAELTNNYRTDRSKKGRPNSLDFGFVLAEATGNLPAASEIDTPIVYGDFYFIEANERKIAYEMSK